MTNTDIALVIMMLVGLGSLLLVGKKQKEPAEVIVPEKQLRRFTVDEENERWARAHKARLEEIHHAK